jgi:outer membrane receptor protein involved in Fe transport
VPLSAQSRSAAGQQAPAQPPTPTPPEPEETTPPIYTEAVVVTASKVEQQLVNAPATVSGDLLRHHPELAHQQLRRAAAVGAGDEHHPDLGARLQHHMRGATSTLSTSQLALLDGRSLYLDFFGFIAWDLVPVNAFELQQVEVIRGPGVGHLGRQRAVGVINFISKTPRELNGEQPDDELRRLQPQSGRGREPRHRRPLLGQRHARPGRQRPVGLQAVGRATSRPTPSRGRPG